MPVFTEVNVISMVSISKNKNKKNEKKRRHKNAKKDYCLKKFIETGP